MRKRPEASGIVRLWDLGRLAARTALLGSTGLVLAVEVDRSAPAGVEVFADVVYRKVEGRALRLDLYVPSRPAPIGGRPAVIAIHGGGWCGGTRGTYGRAFARLVRHGCVVVSVDYRLAEAGSAGWPGDFEDVREAVRWTRLHARDYGIDRARVAALGSSAGGHLAALLGTYPDGPVVADSPREDIRSRGPLDSARVDAVVDFYGPTDLDALRSASPKAREPIDLLLGGPPGSIPPGRAGAASPIRFASADDPPILLIHGERDPLIPVDQSTRLASTLGKLGVEARLLSVEGAGHGFDLRVGDRDLLPEVLAFLHSAWNHEVHASEQAARPVSPSAIRAASGSH